MKNKLGLEKAVSIIIITLVLNMLTGCTSMGGKESIGDCLVNINTNIKDEQSKKNENQDKTRVLNYNEVKDSLIRFHVIANSDTDEDQKLKLKVKDKVIDYLYPYLSASKSLDESRQIIKNNMPKVNAIAEQVIKENKYDYSVKVELSRENFPDKSYGNITLPQGSYEAFRIIIGSGQGKNWWCVMFPPLCFVDESKAQVEYDKTEDRIKASQKQSDSKLETSLDKNDVKEELEPELNNKEKIQLKFKIVEVFKDLLKVHSNK